MTSETLIIDLLIQSPVFNAFRRKFCFLPCPILLSDVFRLVLLKFSCNMPLYQAFSTFNFIPFIANLPFLFLWVPLEKFSPPYLDDFNKIQTKSMNRRLR